MRRAPKLTEVLPVLYLRGLSTEDFKPALDVLLGLEATAGLSPTTIARLTAEWEHDYAAFRKRDLSELTPRRGACARDASTARRIQASRASSAYAPTREEACSVVVIRARARKAGARASGSSMRRESLSRVRAMRRPPR